MKYNTMNLKVVTEFAKKTLNGNIYWGKENKTPC